jgi:aspartyl/asparaginyl beta-hydroxylase (cupin superfamily)
MLNEKNKQENSDNLNLSKKPIKYFYDIEDFPKFKILEENYEGILEEVLNVVKKENEINLETTKITDEDLLYSNIQNKGNLNNKAEVIYFKDPEKNQNDNNENNNNNNKENKTFEPWVEKNLYQESNEIGWDVAPLMIGGVKIPDRCKKFPFLFELVGKISGVISVSYSLLKPGTHIVPHKGYDDYSEKMYRFHMGMIVPEGDIGIRVEKDIRKWENAKSFVFDDFMIHEAWNFTCQNRLVLIIDFLKDESKVPDSIKFVDANFNKSVGVYLNNDKDGK